MSRTMGLNEEFFVECFTSRLKDKTQSNVVIFRLTTLIQAFGLAKLQEETKPWLEIGVGKTRFGSGLGQPDWVSGCLG